MKRILKVTLVREYDSDPDLSWLITECELTPDLRIISSCQYSGEDILEYGEEQVLAWILEDHARCRAYGDSWHMVGVRAVAEVVVRGAIITVQTPGIWGIESDSDEEYFNAVALDECDYLRELLLEMDFSEAEIQEAIVRREWV